MKKIFKLASVIILGIMFVGNAFADIPDRIQNEQSRIDQGIAAGSLTRAEADVLQDNLNWIRAAFARMKADGTISPAERARLNTMLDQCSQMIFNKKHNPITRVYKADIPAMIDNQQFRIEEGIRNGSLTRAEAAVLQDNLNWIQSAFSRMKAAGSFTPAEKLRLEEMLRKSSLMIYNKKHNAIRRLY